MIDIEASPQLTSEETEAAARLIALAEALGLEPLDLDEAVHDAAARYASDESNTGSWDDVDSDAAYDEAGRQAADLNNSGMDNQIRYLVAQCGADRTEVHIRAAAGQPHA
ncbi:MULTISPECIES: hypothetical protein [Streptomyces]|uniref:Uncharacterized protein n=1 Tax=Streptomyces canarius TaxID=285453 RepID=A0ABQ3CF27_9ACTN|nr:hypothetical protein [Streptomyces canarius]GHA08856.1 hypothetical protein GCM10010345_11540 [Streptomyces canarius]